MAQTASQDLASASQLAHVRQSGTGMRRRARHSLRPGPGAAGLPLARCPASEHRSKAKAIRRLGRTGQLCAVDSGTSGKPPWTTPEARGGERVRTSSGLILAAVQVPTRRAARLATARGCQQVCRDDGHVRTHRGEGPDIHQVADAVDGVAHREHVMERGQCLPGERATGAGELEHHEHRTEGRANRSEARCQCAAGQWCRARSMV